MKVTFPHMGSMYISIKVLLETIGIEYIMPPFCSKKTLEIGVTHSPEFICLPFKILIGDFIRAIENGADLVLMGGGCGQCRLGYYGDLQEVILKSIGYKVKFIYINVGNMSFKEILHILSPLTKGKSIINIIKGAIYAAKTVFMVDGLNHLANYTRCREIDRGRTDKIIKQFTINIQKIKGYKGVKEAILSAKKELKAVKIDSSARPLKIAIVGEIYACIEPYVNLDIERKLGNMQVEVHNKVNISHWIKEHFIKNIFPVRLKDKVREAGKEFMRTDDIGGHGLETIGSSILSAKNKYDGVIHIYPLTCMPEIVAQSSFNEIQNKYGIPIITLVVDEITGEAGYITRIEAFIDMLERKREERENQNTRKQTRKNPRIIGISVRK